MPSAAPSVTSSGGGPRVPTGLLLGAVIAAVLGGGIATAVARGDDSGSAAAGSTTPTPTLAPTRTSSAPSPPASLATPTPSAGSPPSSAPETCPSSAPGAADGGADLFTPPSTWSRVPDAAAGTGPVDIDKAASLDGDGLAAVGLRQLCFVRGISRQWQDNGLILVDLVCTFGTEQGAQAYAATAVTAREKDPAFTAVDPGPGAPAGARAFTTSSAGSTGRVVVFVAGKQATILGLVRNAAAPDPATLAAFAAAQAQVSAATSRS